MLAIRRLAYWLLCSLTASVLIFQTKHLSRLTQDISYHESVVKDEAANDISYITNSTPAVAVEHLSSPIPAALQPSSFTSCCTQLSKKKIPNDLRSAPKSTCLTPQACEFHTLYPFQSEEEREFLQKYTPEAEYRETCKKAADRLNPEITWCKVTTSGTNTTANRTSVPETFYPTGCSRYSMSGRSGPYDRLLIFPTHKLAFCGIPKSGITRWIQFLRFTFGARDYQDRPYFKLDHMQFLFDSLHPDRQHEIWNDPEWTRAVLIREPTERLLSAYLDKVAPRASFGNISLEEFVTILEQPPGNQSGLSWYTDPHWRPQAYTCGMAQMLPSLDYVGGLDRVSEHARNILSRVGLWESHGRHYRLTPKEQLPGFPYRIPPPDATTVPATGFQQSLNHTDHHSRKAQDKLDQYFTPELLERVRKLYWMDYALWDALQQAGVGQQHGKDIAAILNSKECSGRKQLFD